MSGPDPALASDAYFANGAPTATSSIPAKRPGTPPLARKLAAAMAAAAEVDEFGLPIRQYTPERRASPDLDEDKGRERREVVTFRLWSRATSGKTPKKTAAPCAEEEKPAQETAPVADAEKTEQKTAATCAKAETPEQKTAATCAEADEPAQETAPVAEAEKSEQETAATCAEAEEPAQETAPVADAEKPEQTTAAICAEAETPAQETAAEAEKLAPCAEAEERSTPGNASSEQDEGEDEEEEEEDFKSAVSSQKPTPPRTPSDLSSTAPAAEYKQEPVEGEKPAGVNGAHSRGGSTHELPDQAVKEAKKDAPLPGHSRVTSLAGAANVTNGLGISEFSHQQLTTAEPEKKGDADDGWQPMPAFARYDMYDDDNRLIAKEYDEAADPDATYGYAGLGGAGKGYTRVFVDDDNESAASIDEHTQYLFKSTAGADTCVMEDEEAQRDAVSQLQATKDLLTEGQRIAYVGLTRLELSAMIKDASREFDKAPRKIKKEVQMCTENMKMWSQKMMIRLYSHMEISQAEQVMIEQLDAHGVIAADLTPLLMANARVKNPMAVNENETAQASTSKSPRRSEGFAPDEGPDEEPVAEPPPPYQADDDSELTAPVQLPSTMSTEAKIDIDLRWTVLCDLFLVLIADSIYDARSRTLLERVAKNLDLSWIDICRFERKVTDALEMQQNAEKENWNEDDHMETRRKLALKRRYVMMGLATVGGGLVIGLSAGLLAPMIGAGLAAGFTTIGVSGTGTFLASTGAAAVITGTAATSGGLIGNRAADRRMGAVKTFEYRPLHNSKRVNLILTISGWMTGKVDDVRLPFSTVDPVMGDMYSVLWEPEMLRSMGDTINILATEALTQGLQQVLASTILMSLMAALQLPIVLTKLAYLIDNPWTVSLDRATAAGLILADSLIDRNLGTRPITLVGYSLGSRVIFSCLQELARKGAYGLIQNVYLYGSPVVVKPEEYMRARTVVSGRFLNAFNPNDWILGYLFRLTNGGIRRVAGLAAIRDIPGIENVDVSEFVVGHMDYRTAMPRLLREAGWLVENDEFTEIEDPDPENHGERQRELINEIEEARRELEKEHEGKADKGAFTAFWRRKKQEKQAWELYDESKGTASGLGRLENSDKADKVGTKNGNSIGHGTLFDVDAIRAELAKEKLGVSSGPAEAGVGNDVFQVREIKSTLPPMKLDLRGSSPSPRPPAPPPKSSTRPTSPLPPVPPPPPPPKKPTHDPPSSRTPSYSTGRPAETLQQYFRATGPDDDEPIQMTFETTHANATPNPPSRPAVKPSQTVPNITFNQPLAEEDFGDGEEITLTFA